MTVRGGLAGEMVQLVWMSTSRLFNNDDDDVADSEINHPTILVSVGGTDTVPANVTISARHPSVSRDILRNFPPLSD